ncbi:hypothetical protein ACNVED_07720 [Legionella sp. D16C41]|uniref:hypothetical protein n=1 Tax=Legionella sp. D16C41 TaxID=3402688 RepID=UPI003AF40F03
MLKVMFYLLLIFLTLLNTTYAQPPASTSLPSHKLFSFFTNKNRRLEVKQTSLPVPYDYLLKQPLLTLGLKKYYQRTPMIEVLAAKLDSLNKRYNRVILMLIV